MNQIRRGTKPALIILLALVSVALIGTVVAQDRYQASCPQDGACNGSGYYGYGPGMMGGYYGYGMMGYGDPQSIIDVETGIMGTPIHNEMEELTAKMLARNLTPADQNRMIAIMKEYPGPSNMMMTRMMGGYGAAYASSDGINPGSWGHPGMMGYGTPGYGMMNGGLLALMMIICALFILVWLIAGILLIIWLVKQLRKERSADRDQRLI